MRLGLEPRGHLRRLPASTRGSSSRSRASSTPRRRSANSACPRRAEALRALKAMGFSDAAARRTRRQAGQATCARCASQLGVRPVYKRIDTCAAEFASPTAYMYSTYETPVRRRRRRRGAALRPQEGRHPRRRPQPHRPGHRVRLLLLPCRLRAARTPATRPSWSTAIPRPSRPTTTPPTGSISSR